MHTISYALISVKLGGGQAYVVIGFFSRMFGQKPHFKELVFTSKGVIILISALRVLAS